MTSSWLRRKLKLSFASMNVTVGIGWTRQSSLSDDLAEGGIMNQEERGLANQDSADQEIPDRATADAAKWLSEQNAGFDTPTFWLVCGLLVLHSAELQRRLDEYTENRKVADCVDCGGSIWFREARIQDENGTYHPMCRITKRAEAAGAKAERLEKDCEGLRAEIKRGYETNAVWVKRAERYRLVLERINSMAQKWDGIELEPLAREMAIVAEQALSGEVKP